jgi:hypothetical protein
VRLFLDTSVLLAASGSGKGASRFVVTEAAAHGWELVGSDYCDEETRRNLPKVGRSWPNPSPKAEPKGCTLCTLSFSLQKTKCPV